VYPAEIITYTLRVTNIGKRTATDVLVRDAVPGSLRFVKGSESSDDPNAVFSPFDNWVAWILPELPVGVTQTFTFQTKVGGMEGVGSRWINDSAQAAETRPNEDPVQELRNNPYFQSAEKVRHVQSIGATIVVHKVDAVNGEPLADAEFTLRVLSVLEPALNFGEWTAITNADGEATFEDVPIGKYEVTETRSPDGYLRNNLRRSVNIDGTQWTRELTFSNWHEDFLVLAPNAGAVGRTEGDCPN
jgi:uncharacterized repeat protein (TIGR01451 family)